MSTNSINISHIQALNLELKLNKSSFGKDWIYLGDFLFNSRINPKNYHVEKLEYQITNEQFDWIKINLEIDNLNKPYRLFV
jgi:hypothetical protein